MLDDGKPDGFNQAIPAGYTYFGQFVDHDMTLDVTPLSESDVDPERLHNFRTPRLDLDCVYGRGPTDQPYLYDHSKPDSSLSFTRFSGKLLTGAKISDTEFTDLPRNAQQRAIIGDMRNDENAIVAQIQLAFVLAHNTLVQRAITLAERNGKKLDGNTAFTKARRTLCWLYQWIVWKDFVRRIVKTEIHEHALAFEPKPPDRSMDSVWKLGFPRIFNWKQQPFMPIEFSTAAYRFGHSMVRDSYQTNGTSAAGFNVFIDLFGAPGGHDSLQGFRPLDKRRLVQWDWFLSMTTSKPPFPQLTRKIDTRLSRSLTKLPDNFSNIAPILAARNLVRGVRMKLPSGPDVARKLGVTPIQLDSMEDSQLWFYILKEAEKVEQGQSLGEVGSRILCAVFAGLLKGDPSSWINVEPNWTPDGDPLLFDDDKVDGARDNDGGDNWKLASIIRLSGLPVSEDAFASSSHSGASSYGAGNLPPIERDKWGNPL